MIKSKKIWKIVLILIMVLLLLISFTACSIYYYLTSVEFNYVVNQDAKTVTITGIETDDRVLVIPNTIDEYPVTAIADYAFKNNNNLSMVKVPDTILYIGEGAFYNCENLLFVFGLKNCTNIKAIEDNTFQGCNDLHTIELPNSITSIGNCAFEFCYNLRELSIPDSVSCIGEKAFSNCQSIKEIKIPQGVTKIENQTFLGCASMESVILPQGIIHITEGAFDTCMKLKSVVIPNTVTTIEFGAFIKCYSLSSIDVALDNPVYTSVDGVLYTKNLTELVAYPAGKTDKTFSVPQGVTKIFKYAFTYNQNLDTLDLPKSLKTINNLFLYETLIKTINYEGSVSDWNKIATMSALDCGDLFEMINCTDGQITKDGTVTYK